MEGALEVESGEDEKNNHLEFAANGSIIVSKLRRQAMHVNERLAKLKINAMAEILSWVKEDDLHSHCVAWFKAFYKLQSSAFNSISNSLQLDLS